MPDEGFFRDPLLIDTSAFMELLDPIMVRQVWQRYDSKVQHCVCSVVCYEMFQGQDADSNKNPFRNWLAKGTGKLLPADAQCAKNAARLAVLVAKEADPNDDDKEGRIAEVRRLNNDIQIAGVAIQHGLTVFTEDEEDWRYLEDVVVRHRSLFTNQLQVVTKVDLTS